MPERSPDDALAKARTLAARLRGSKTVLPESKIALWDDPEDPRHGTLNGYHNFGCRCERCKVRNAANCRVYRGQWTPEQRERERLRKVEFNRRRTALARRNRADA